MLRVAIVEDDPVCAEQLCLFLTRYSEESGEVLDVSAFSDGLDIVEGYCPVYDVILLDIEMPQLDGMSAAQRIRAFDPTVVLIFITNMAQYAIRGYEVDAMDFVLKPVSYFAFSLKMKKAFSAVRVRAARELMLPLEGGMKRVPAADISYIEVLGHKLNVHVGNTLYTLSGSLREMEEQLAGEHFVRCNKCYLVNLRHITDVRQSTITTGGDELQISRPRKKEFLQALTDFYGGGGR